MGTRRTRKRSWPKASGVKDERRKPSPLCLDDSLTIHHHPSMSFPCTGLATWIGSARIFVRPVRSPRLLLVRGFVIFSGFKRSTTRKKAKHSLQSPRSLASSILCNSVTIVHSIRFLLKSPPTKFSIHHHHHRRQPTSTSFLSVF